MNNWTQLYYQNKDKNNNLTLEQSLALDIFFHAYNADSFINRPLKEGQIYAILEDCLNASKLFLSKNEEKSEEN